MDHPHLFQSATPVHEGERFGLKKEEEKDFIIFFSHHKGAANGAAKPSASDASRDGGKKNTFLT